MDIGEGAEQGEAVRLAVFGEDAALLFNGPILRGAAAIAKVSPDCGARAEGGRRRAEGGVQVISKW